MRTIAKTALTTATLLGQAALLAGCTTSSASSGTASHTCPPSRNWNAFVNAMPGPGATPTLIVSGEVELPRGTTAALVPGPTDRMMPPGQRFALQTGKGAGPSGWQSVRAEISPALPSYREVVVSCGGATLARISPIVRAM